MVRTIMNNKHLSKMIDDCIEDLDGGGAKLIDLSQLLGCLGETVGNNCFTALMAPIGGYGGEILSFRPFISAFFKQIMPEDTYTKNQELFKEAIQAGKASLEIIKTELCNKKDSNPKQIIEAISTLTKYDYKLGLTRHIILRSRPQAMEQSE